MASFWRKKRVSNRVKRRRKLVVRAIFSIMLIIWIRRTVMQSCNIHESSYRYHFALLLSTHGKSFVVSVYSFSQNFQIRFEIFVSIEQVGWNQHHAAFVGLWKLCITSYRNDSRGNACVVIRGGTPLSASTFHASSSSQLITQTTQWTRRTIN